MNGLKHAADCGFRPPLVLMKGAGDLASGTALRLARAGFPIVMTELPRPTVIRRTVAFAQAVYDGEATLEGLTAEACGPDDFQKIEAILGRGRIPVAAGTGDDFIEAMRPAALVEATLSKKNTGLNRREGRWTIALGPGYTAGADVDAVVETMRGHFLGQVIYDGAARPDTGRPGLIGGYDLERLIKAPAAGPVEFFAEIGDWVTEGQVIGKVGETPIRAAISGCLRGALQKGLEVPPNFKIGDIDPRPDSAQYVHTASDKARAIGGGVLEALMFLMRQERRVTENSTGARL